MVWIFVMITAVAVLYFLYLVFAGEGDGFDGGEFGLMLATAFTAGFGAVGIMGSLAGWDLLPTLLIGVAIGYVFGIVVQRIMRFVMRQQSTDVKSGSALIGSSGRVTVDVPAGKMGEMIIETGEVSKYTILEQSGGALQKGDIVEVVNFTAGIAIVKRKRAG
jgi:membrane protein implicated in regulation of membrane protease activity